MRPGQFNVEGSRNERGAAVSVSGELDVATVGEFRQAVDAALADAQHIDIDLSELEFLDSSGLRVIVEIHNAAEQRGFSYSIIPGPPQVHRTFVLTGLDKVLVFASQS